MAKAVLILTLALLGAASAASGSLRQIETTGCTRWKPCNEASNIMAALGSSSRVYCARSSKERAFVVLRNRCYACTKDDMHPHILWDRACGNLGDRARAGVVGGGIQLGSAIGSAAGSIAGGIGSLWKAASKAASGLTDCQHKYKLVFDKKLEKFPKSKAKWERAGCPCDIFDQVESSCPGFCEVMKKGANCASQEEAKEHIKRLAQQQAVKDHLKKSGHTLGKR